MLLNLLLVVATAAALLQAWRQEVGDVEQATRATARLLESTVSKTFDKVALLLDGAALRLQAQLVSGGIDRDELWPFMDRVMARVNEVQLLAVFDDQGQQVCGTNQPARCRQIQIADRAYFQALKAGPGYHLAGPFESRMDGRQVLVIARRLSGQEGRFAGVVIALIPVDALRSLLHVTQHDQQSAASLRSADMQLLVRDPPLPPGADSQQISQPLAALLARQPDSGLYRSPTASDGVDRVTAYQRLTGWPAYVLVGQAAEEFLAIWRRTAWAAAVFLLLFAAGSWQLAATLQRRTAAAERAQRLYDTAPCGYHTLDASGRYLSVNATECAWLGCPAEALVGRRSPRDFFSPASQQTFDTCFPTLRQLGTLDGLALELVGSDGGRRHVRVSAKALFDEQGAYIGSNSVMHDVTAQHDAEMLKLRAVELQALNRQLVETNRLKDEFLGNLSHELLTPLNAIMGFAQLLTAAVGSGDAARLLRYGSQINTSSQQLLQLIQAQLDFAQVEAGKMSFELQAVDLPLLLAELVGVQKQQAESRQIMLRTSCAPELRQVVADRLRLLQLLSLLLDNALKFSMPGGHVHLQALSDEPGWWCVNVADDGIGIANADQEKVFEKFVQLSSGNTKMFGGVGMGLALARQMARAMGGDVVVKSEPGNGAVFRLRLPMAPGQA